MGTSILRAIMKKLTAKVGNLLGHTVLMRGEEPICAADSNLEYGIIMPIYQAAQAQGQAQNRACNWDLPRFVRQVFACRPVHAIHRLLDWFDRILSFSLPPHLIFPQLLAKLRAAVLAEELVPLLLSRLLMPVRESTSG